MFEILSIINWDGDEWDVVYRYRGTLRSAKIHSDYRPTNGETKRHLEEIHNVG